MNSPEFHTPPSRSQRRLSKGTSNTLYDEATEKGEMFYSAQQSVAPFNLRPAEETPLQAKEAGERRQSAVSATRPWESQRRRLETVKEEAMSWGAPLARHENFLLFYLMLFVCFWFDVGRFAVQRVRNAEAQLLDGDGYPLTNLRWVAGIGVSGPLLIFGLLLVFIPPLRNMVLPIIPGF